MQHRKNRRALLKQGLTAGTGLICCCASLSCNKPPEKTAAPKTKPPSQDFNKVGYCSFACEQKCKIFAATKNNDLQAKAGIAERWKQKFGVDVKPEDVACLGCKTENLPLSYYAQKCTVRKCAREKQVVTCAHCDDFPACDKKLWTDWPGIRQAIEKIRNELQA